MQFTANEARMAAPGSLADDMAIRAETGFSQLDYTRKIKQGQPERITVKDAFVVIVDQTLVVPVDGFEAIDGRSHRLDLRRLQHLAQQNEALLVHGL